MSSPLDMRTMNNGGVVEAVNIALAKVADNIADVNTPPDKPRTVTLKITFKPDESRTLIASKAVVTTNLQPQEPQTIPVVLDKLDGAPMLFESFTDNRPDQYRFDGTSPAELNLCARAGVAHFSAHSLRHFMATHFDDPHRAQKVLGHKNLRTTEIYLHELGVDRKAADVFESITNGKSSTNEKGLTFYSKPLKFMAKRGRFRLNHPNSLNFMPVWLRLLHRPYP